MKTEAVEMDTTPAAGMFKRAISGESVVDYFVRSPSRPVGYRHAQPLEDRSSSALLLRQAHLARPRQGVSWMTEAVEMDFDVQQGLFLATLRGPGKAYLQTMPMGKLAQKVAQYMPQVGGDGASGGGNVDLGQLFGGRYRGRDSGERCRHAYRLGQSDSSLDLRDG